MAASVLVLLVATVIGVVMYLGHKTADAFEEAANSIGQGTQQAPDPNAGAVTPDEPYTPDVATPDPVTPETPEPVDTIVPLTVPDGGSVCSTAGTGAFATAVSGNDHTSCPFSDAVRDAYQSSMADGADATLTVYSPVTKKDYEMSCTGTGPVECTGGNDALVILGSLTGGTG